MPLGNGGICVFSCRGTPMCAGSSLSRKPTPLKGRNCQGDVRDQHLVASSLLGAMLKGEKACDKISIAANGNLVPQLRFHVIGRWRSGPYWPGVVWGGRFRAGIRDCRSTKTRKPGYGVFGCLQGGVSAFFR